MVGARNICAVVGDLPSPDIVATSEPFRYKREDRHPLFAKESAGHGVTNGVIEVTQFTRCPLSVAALAGYG